MEALDKLDAALGHHVEAAIKVPNRVTPGAFDHLALALFWNPALVEAACKRIVAAVPQGTDCVAAISRLGIPFAASLSYWLAQERPLHGRLVRLDIEDLPSESHVSEGIRRAVDGRSVILCDDTVNSGHNALRAVDELSSLCSVTQLWVVYDNVGHEERSRVENIRARLTSGAFALC